MPSDRSPDEPAPGQAPGPAPAGGPAPESTAAALVARVSAWWLVRLAAPIGVVWVLWQVFPPSVTLAAAAALVLASAAFLAPGDLPQRPSPAPGSLVVVWDLIVLATVTAVWIVVTHPHGLVPTAVLPVLVALLVRLRTWAALTGPPSRSSAARIALAVAGVLVAALLSPLFRHEAAHALKCAGLASIPGGGGTWTDAEPVEGAPARDHPALGVALWRSDQVEGERIADGHGDTVTMVQASGAGKGFAVRAADDGRVLWHVGRDRLSAYVPTEDLVHQVGDTVVAEFREREDGEGRCGPGARAVGYDASTGQMRWCVPGLWDITTDIRETERFAARIEGPHSGWALHEASDGSEVTGLAVGGDAAASHLQVRAHMSDGRVTVFSTRGLASYSVATAEPTGVVTDVHDRVDSGSVRAVTHVGPVTAASLETETDPVQYGVAAYGPGAQYLWDSVGPVRMAEGEPLAGSTFADCTGDDGTTSHRGFDGHLLTTDRSGEDRRVAAVSATDGNVVWALGDEHASNYCFGEHHVDEGTLTLDTGETADAEAPITASLDDPDSGLEDAPVLMFAGNGTATGAMSASPVVFHALP